MSGDSFSTNPNTNATSNNNSSTSSSTTTTTNSAMNSPAAGASVDGTVSRSKTKMTDGTKIKMKSDGKVEVKDGDGLKIN